MGNTRKRFRGNQTLNGEKYPKNHAKNGLGSPKICTETPKMCIKTPKKKKKNTSNLARSQRFLQVKTWKKAGGKKIQGKIQLDMAKKTSKITLKMAK